MQLKHMDPAARESSFRKQQQESEDLRKMQGYIEAEKDRDLSEIEKLGYTLLKEKIYKTNKHVFFENKE